MHEQSLTLILIIILHLIILLNVYTKFQVTGCNNFTYTIHSCKILIGQGQPRVII